MLKAANDKLRGFRGIITVILSWVMIFADQFTVNLAGLSWEAIKASMIVSGPITVKLAWTDAKPRIMAWWNAKEEE